MRGVRISSVVAMTSQGVLTYDCTTGTMNGDKFFYFVRGKVIMHAALPRSKLDTLMDNCSIHHIDQVKQELESAGILVIFLPPYSPLSIYVIHYKIENISVCVQI